MIVQFVDRRIGESGEVMSAEEKERKRADLVHEKLLKSKGARYSLAEDDEELTHLGVSLSNVQVAATLFTDPCPFAFCSKPYRFLRITVDPRRCQ